MTSQTVEPTAFQPTILYSEGICDVHMTNPVGENERKNLQVDLTALNGLRGLVALHILVFHCFIYSELKWNFQGSVSMPIFFILSGFTLAVTYFNTDFEGCGINKYNSIVHNSEESRKLIPKVNDSDYYPSKVLAVYSFYQNRFARVAPVYYVTTFLTIPLVFLGHAGPSEDKLPFSLTVSMLGISSWFVFAPLNGPSWTVSTLAFWWWFFPCTFKSCLNIPTHNLLKTAMRFFWLQLLVGVVLVGIVSAVVSGGSAFVVTTMNPLSRWPVFGMGCLAGIWRARMPFGWHGPESTEDDKASGYLETWIGALTAPWLVKEEHEWKNGEQTQESVQMWRKMVSWHSGFQGGLICVFSLLSAAGSSISWFKSELWLQLLLPYSIMILILGLTLDQGTSWISQFYRMPIMQELGRYSMSIYLVHEQVIGYVTMVAKGTKNWPDCATGKRFVDESDWCEDNCDVIEYTDCVDFMEGRSLPVWGIPIVIVVSLIFGFGLTVNIEEPFRKYLRSK